MAARRRKPCRVRASAASPRQRQWQKQIVWPRKSKPTRRCLENLQKNLQQSKHLIRRRLPSPGPKVPINVLASTYVKLTVCLSSYRTCGLVRCCQRGTKNINSFFPGIVLLKGGCFQGLLETFFLQTVGTVWCQTTRQHISEAWGLLLIPSSPPPRKHAFLSMNISGPVWNCAMLTPSVGKKMVEHWKVSPKKTFQNLNAQLELCDTHALQHLLSCWFQNPSGPTSGIVDFWGSSAIQKKQGLNFSQQYLSKKPLKI